MATRVQDESVLEQNLLQRQAADILIIFKESKHQQCMAKKKLISGK
jgi:hypothetical protein